MDLIEKSSELRKFGLTSYEELPPALRNSYLLYSHITTNMVVVTYCIHMLLLIW